MKFRVSSMSHSLLEHTNERTLYILQMYGFKPTEGKVVFGEIELNTLEELRDLVSQFQDGIKLLNSGILHILD